MNSSSWMGSKHRIVKVPPSWQMLQVAEVHIGKNLRTVLLCSAICFFPFLVLYHSYRHSYREKKLQFNWTTAVGKERAPPGHKRRRVWHTWRHKQNRKLFSRTQKMTQPFLLYLYIISMILTTNTWPKMHYTTGQLYTISVQEIGD